MSAPVTAEEAAGVLEPFNALCEAMDKVIHRMHGPDVGLRETIGPMKVGGSASNATITVEALVAASDLLQRLRSQSGPLPVQGGPSASSTTDNGGCVSPNADGDRQRYRHKKRGEAVTVLGEAEAQISIDDGNGINCRLVCEADKIVVYRADDGKLWWRFPDEFYDGRFLRIDALPPAPGQDPAAGPEVTR